MLQELGRGELAPIMRIAWPYKTIDYELDVSPWTPTHHRPKDAIAVSQPLIAWDRATAEGYCRPCLSTEMSLCIK